MLREAGYGAVVNDPTDWSRSMRPALSNVVRRACSTVVSLGVGGGRAVSAVELTSAGPLRASDAVAALRPLVDAIGIVGVHLGVEDEPAGATHPLQAAWVGAASGRASKHQRFVLLIEGADADSVGSLTSLGLSLLRPALGDDLDASATATYEVATWVEKSHLASQPGSQPAQPRIAWLRACKAPFRL